MNRHLIRPSGPHTLFSKIAEALALALGLLLVASLQGCSPKNKGRLSIATSVFPAYELTRRVAGDDADVTLLVPAEKSTAVFSPSASDRDVIARSRVSIMIGLGFDSWMETIAKEVAPKGAKLLKVGDRVPTIEEETGKDEAPRVDPYVWLDPSRARLIVKAIAEELSRADGAHAEAYRKRAEALDATFDALDKEVEGRTAVFAKRSFATVHPSFAYFAERYRLHTISLFDITAPIATSPAVHALEIAKASAIFREPGLDAALAAPIAAEAKLPVGVLDPIGGGPEAASYEALIRFNLDALEKTLR